MEGLHKTEYSFPTPNEIIDSAPKETESERLQREADILLDEKVKATGEGGLDQFFQTLSQEIFSLDIARNWPHNYNINGVNNRREFVDGTEEFRIDFDMVHKNILKEEIGNTYISINFGDEIEITYSSSVEGYNQIPENTVTLLSPLDIREVLNSVLVITPELEI